jgi:hypothetical protein
MRFLTFPWTTAFKKQALQLTGKGIVPRAL